MEKCNISLRQITEDNFIEAFNLKLANGQEQFCFTSNSKPCTGLCLLGINVSRLESIRMIL